MSRASHARACGRSSMRSSRGAASPRYLEGLADGAGAAAERRRTARGGQRVRRRARTPAGSAISSNGSRWSMTAIRSRRGRPGRADDAAYLEGARISGRSSSPGWKKACFRTCARRTTPRGDRGRAPALLRRDDAGAAPAVSDQHALARTLRPARRTRGRRAFCARSSRHSAAPHRARAKARSGSCARRRASPTSITATASCRKSTVRRATASQSAPRSIIATFGRGVIRRREGRGEAAKVWIAFERGGLKLLVLKFANLKPVAD